MGSGLNRTALAALLAAIAVAIGVSLGSAGRGPAPETEPDSTLRVETADVEVHVAGWVMAPGVVSVHQDAIVATAIEAAGGFRPGARTDRINLAAPIIAGEQIVVPGPDDSATSSESSDGLLSLNRATAAELETLPGIGPVTAERIVAFRDSNGPFAQVEDLLEVPGIGEAKLAAIRDLVRP